MSIVVSADGVLSPVDLPIASKTRCTPSSMLDVPLALVVPTEAFPTGTAEPFSPGILDWVGLVAARFVLGQWQLVALRGARLGGRGRREQREVVRESAVRVTFKRVQGP